MVDLLDSVIFHLDLNSAPGNILFVLLNLEVKSLDEVLVISQAGPSSLEVNLERSQFAIFFVDRIHVVKLGLVALVLGSEASHLHLQLVQLHLQIRYLALGPVELVADNCLILRDHVHFPVHLFNLLFSHHFRLRLLSDLVL